MRWQKAKATILSTLLEKEKLGLITDVDGTISPIVAHADDAQVVPEIFQTLQELPSFLSLVAVLSGRSVRDLIHRVDIPTLTYVGNHGLERWVEGNVLVSPEAAAFRPALKSALEAIKARQLPGMWVEDKNITLSVHYRQTEDPDQVAVSFLPIIQDISTETGLALFHGRRVFELRPPVQADKGSAFRQLVEEHNLEGVLYLGDDTTDLPALSEARRLREEGVCYAVGLGVESSGSPKEIRAQADLLVLDVADVGAFLAWLLTARKASFT